MKLGNRVGCRYCSRPVLICPLRGGQWRPFDLDMVALADEHPDAHLPITYGARPVLVPVADVAPRHLEGVRWVAKRHRCAQFYRAKAAERENVDGMGAVADQLVAHFTTHG